MLKNNIMKKSLIVPLLLTVWLLGGCSLHNQAKAPVNNDSAIEPFEEVVPEPAPEPVPMAEILDQSVPAPQPPVDDPIDSDSAVAWPLYAQICADGLVVSRVAPDCQFAPCP